MNIFQKIFKKAKKKIEKATRPPRERLKKLYFIEVDGILFTAYETQTVDYDWVNIEVEERKGCFKRIILKDEIADDSWGTLGGDSFFSLVMSSRGHLHRYIKEIGETITYESELL